MARDNTDETDRLLEGPRLRGTEGAAGGLQGQREVALIAVDVKTLSSAARRRTDQKWVGKQTTEM